ncbi:hypothetical protein ACX1DX_07820 [Tessaracoccus sp. Y36]|uniref:hypothetical protein n=1 Tax=Tessaracoccus sp. MC1756 TaxID=2760311 RepID=UPI00160446A9|nr:hypothetical protein [Tessaracoccus sp. MC1756]MBB1508476.1 hypothetical protein [Tessaracoccus sp. MC1756]
MVGRRAAHKSSERTIALTILAVGTVVSLASMAGNVWLVRAGVIVAVLMAVAAVYVVWRQLSFERVLHSEELKHEVDLRSQQADRHHAESVAMIERYNARADNLKAVIAKLRGQLGAAKSELSSMRGNSVWLRAEVAERQARIVALEKRIADLEAERAERQAENTANIVELPSRALHPSIDDIWGEDEHPTMVDIAKLNLDVLPDLRRHA